MASPSPFLFDTNAYPPIDTSFTQYEPMANEGELQFPGTYGINQQFPQQGHYAHHLQPMPMSHSPMPHMSGSMTPLNMPSAGAYSLQAINMQSSGVNNGFQQQIFGGHTPPPLSATSSSSSDSLQTTVSMSDIMPAPPMTSASDSSLTAMSPSPSIDDEMSRSPSPSPRMTRAHLKREATMINLHSSQPNSPNKKRRSGPNTHQRSKSGSSSHLPPVITKPVDPNGPRITCATFVWPDVTGLSKKDARLVKNRAAAFLSRQRKREEFEAMEKRVAKMESDRKELEIALSAKEAEFGTLTELKDRLSKAEARLMVAENELASKEQTYQAEIARLRGETGASSVSIHQADLARLAVLFSLSSLSNASGSNAPLSVAANLPASVVGEVDLKLEQNKAVNVDLHTEDGADTETGAQSAGLRLTLQRPTPSVTTRRSRAASAASSKEARFNGQLDLTSAPAQDGAQHWEFKLSFGQEA